MKKFILSLLLIPSLCFGVGRIQNEDIKSLADLTGAGGTAAQLINDTKIYLSAGAINEQFSTAITDGSLARKSSLLTTKGDLLGYSTLTIRVPVGTDGQVLTANSGAAAGYSWSATGASPTDPKETYNLGLKSAVAANALTVTLTQFDGSSAPSGGSPVKVSFRGTSATPGNYDEISVTSSIAMTISSGSTLGTVSNKAENIYIYLLNNAGTAEMAISRTKFDEGVLKTTVAEGGAGAADSGTVLYSTTARTLVPIRLIGRLSITEVTAGTWATNSSTVASLPVRDVMQVVKFTANGTFVVPDGIHQLLITGVGGGGGGGGGAGNRCGGIACNGGGGGSGSLPSTHLVIVTPGDSLTIQPAAGGTAGAGGIGNVTNDGQPGGTGGTTLITGSVNLTFSGAPGGNGGIAVTTPFTAGNASVWSSPTLQTAGSGNGGQRNPIIDATNGVNSHTAQGGAFGTATGAPFHPMGGGGGGAGLLDGGAGANGALTNPGTSASAAPAGGGGGGGGAANGVDTSGGTGGAGGVGGAGVVYIAY